MKSVMSVSVQSIAILAVMFSPVMFLTCCKSKSAERLEQVKVNPDRTWRAKVLENNTITYVIKPLGDSNVYKPLDSVWVNLETHRIDDTSNSAMKCVLYIK